MKNRELISHHQPEGFGKGQKETPHIRLPPRILLSGIHLAEQGVHHRKDSESEWLAKDNPETNPISIKHETASHVAELFSWVPSPYCSPPRCPFPIKSLALSAHVSPQTIHFRELDKSQVSGPGRSPLPATRWTRRFHLLQLKRLIFQFYSILYPLSYNLYKINFI